MESQLRTGRGEGRQEEGATKKKKPKNTKKIKNSPISFTPSHKKKLDYEK